MAGKFWPSLKTHRKEVALLIAGVLIGSLILTPVGAHVGGSIDHLWNDHIKSKANARYQSKKPLGSGQSLSGAFSVGAGNSTGAGGWLGWGITYDRPLAAPINDNNIIDVRDLSNAPPECPGIGQADPGYLCLYNTVSQSVDPAYMYSEPDYVNGKVGVVIYWPVTADQPHVGGTWTVTAP